MRSSRPMDTGGVDTGGGDAVKAKDICLRQLTIKPRSRAELIKTLQQRGFDEDTAETVVGRLEEVRLVDDEAFAEAAVHSGHNYRGWGKRRIGAELRRRGVTDEVAKEAVTAVADEDEERRARELVRARLRSIPASTIARDEQAAVRKLVGMLARRGYSGDMVFRVVRDEVAALGVDLDITVEVGEDC